MATGPIPENVVYGRTVCGGAAVLLSGIPETPGIGQEWLVSVRANGTKNGSLRAAG
jgi:hypothetical protein